jgi:hypothetical protein
MLHLGTMMQQPTNQTFPRILPKTDFCQWLAKGVTAEVTLK